MASLGPIYPQESISPTDSRVSGILLGTLIPTLIASIFVIARLYTRSCLTKNWGYDDTLIANAWLGSIVLAVLSCLMVHFGIGQHSNFTKPTDVVPSLKLDFAARLVYQYVLCVTKLGICIFYLRVFQDKTSKRLIYLMVAFIAIPFITIEMFYIVSCKPISSVWDPLLVDQCVNQMPSCFANAILNVLADLFIMAFVLPRIMPLQIAYRQKQTLILVVSLGILVIVAALVRLDCLIQLETSTDLSWDAASLVIWSTIEVNTGLFCASVPTIRPLIRKFAPHMVSSSSKAFSKRSIPSFVGSYGKADGLTKKETKTVEMTESQVWWEDLVEEHVLDPAEPAQRLSQDGANKIVKTVSVTVTEENATGDEKMGWREEPKIT